MAASGARANETATPSRLPIFDGIVDGADKRSSNYVIQRSKFDAGGQTASGLANQSP